MAGLCAGVTHGDDDNWPQFQGQFQRDNFFCIQKVGDAFLRPSVGPTTHRYPFKHLPKHVFLISPP